MIRDERISRQLHFKRQNIADNNKFFTVIYSKSRAVHEIEHWNFRKDCGEIPGPAECGYKMPSSTRDKQKNTWLLSHLNNTPEERVRTIKTCLQKNENA